MVKRIELFVIEAHQGQFRWDNKTPYWRHPEQVVNIIKSWKITDPDIILSAWLHDTVEDTAVTLDDIGNEYGNKVKYIVNELTFPDNVGFNEYLDRCIRMSNSAKIVKIADIMANISDISSNKSHNFVLKRLKALEMLTNNIRLE